MKKFYSVVMLFLLMILTSCASSQKNTRRSDFVSGCAVGAYSLSSSMYMQIPYEEIVYKCVEIYDTKKDEIEPYLDQMDKELKKVKIQKINRIHKKQPLREPIESKKDIYKI